MQTVITIIVVELIVLLLIAITFPSLWEPPAFILFPPIGEAVVANDANPLLLGPIIANNYSFTNRWK